MSGDSPARIGPDATGTARRRVAIYTRTAGPESAASAANHALQEQRCRREAARLGLDVVAVVHDVALPAGFDADKAGWCRVEALVRGRQVEVVLSSDLARLTRSWADVGFLLASAGNSGSTSAPLRARGPTPQRRPRG